MSTSTLTKIPESNLHKVILKAWPSAVIGLTTFILSFICILTRPEGLLASCWLTNAVVVGLMLRQPRFATMPCWIAIILGFLAADLLTGSSWVKTILLTAGNLAGMIVAQSLFLRISALDRGLQRPRSVIYFLAIVAIASAASGILGIVINPFLFKGSASEGFALWFITELVNYMTILPIMLTLPQPRNFIGGFLPKHKISLAKAAPFFSFILSLIAGLVIGGPGALAFPIPALLWCAISYDISKTTFLTFCFGLWAMLSVFTGYLNFGITFDSESDFISYRLGILLVALGPITVASAANALSQALREAALARAAAERARDSHALLLATMSHELRAPLSSIIGYANLIADQLLGPIGNAEYIEFAKTIERNGYHLKDLVNDLLDITKIETQERKPVFENVASYNLIEQSLRLIKGMAFERRISLEIDSSLSWPNIIVDPKSIKQIMINILSNAIKFSPQAGRIVISNEIHDHRLFIKVKDNGPGISAENLALLGKPYVRVHAETEKCNFDSTGLGLSICHKLAAQHGGKLHLESSLGIGTTVIFDVPVASPI